MLQPMTRLVLWARNMNIVGKRMDWNDAMKWANNLNYGGYSDWRLPTWDELASFAKWGRNQASKWFNQNGFDNVQTDYYWSGTTYSGNTNYAWSVNMKSGDMVDVRKTSGYYVWPVRNSR